MTVNNSTTSPGPVLVVWGKAQHLEATLIEVAPERLRSRVKDFAGRPPDLLPDKRLTKLYDVTVEVLMFIKVLMSVVCLFFHFNFRG